MSRLQWFRWLVAAAACVSWSLPAPRLQAAPPVPDTPSKPQSTEGRVIDLALGAHGELTGQVLDAVGRPVPARQVVVQNLSDGQRYETQTDAEGQFVVTGLRAGLIQLASSGTSQSYRCWTQAAAPPVATQRVLLVANDEVERGQKPISDLFLSRPVLLGLIIAAAIAIPIAVHNSRDDDSAS